MQEAMLPYSTGVFSCCISSANDRTLQLANAFFSFAACNLQSLGKCFTENPTTTTQRPLFCLFYFIYFLFRVILFYRKSEQCSAVSDKCVRDNGICSLILNILKFMIYFSEIKNFPRKRIIIGPYCIKLDQKKSH